MTSTSDIYVLNCDQQKYKRQPTSLTYFVNLITDGSPFVQNCFCNIKL